MSLSGHAKLAGVIGSPIGHSLSPRLHGHWLRAYNIDGAYVPLAVSREMFAVAIRGLRAAGVVGVNVTVPHKEAAFAIAGRLDTAAIAAGTANLLVFHGDQIEGRNTDSLGLSASIVEKLGAERLRGAKIGILGTGGAARAAIIAMASSGASEIRLVARNASRGAALVRELQPSCPAVLGSFLWDDWREAAQGIALVINATSAGMTGNAPLDLALEPLARDAAVCDIVYNPLETEFLAAAKTRGHLVIDGLGMLMYQAAPAFEAFYGIKPTVTEALRAELAGALQHGR